ncbi:hypothetical protein LLG96_04485 [bacterium]|nr:hypothetical protein [bacterium]
MEKVSPIDEYFKNWDSDIKKASELLANQHYYLEGILVLSCYIGAFAAMRYPSLKDGEAYVKVVLEYSGNRDFFEQIDLLFLYQWPRSILRKNGNYTKLKNYTEIIDILIHKYGKEEDIKAGKRYVSPSEIIEHVKNASIPGFNEKNLKEKLPLFSNVEILYRYVRCGAVHNFQFPLINQGIDKHGNVIYEDNHAITGQVLLKTTQDILNALRKECLSQSKWPDEL